MTLIQGGNDTAGVANVDAYFNLKVTLPDVYDQSGYNRPMSEVDRGNVTGAPTLLAAETSEDFRLRSELDTILAYDDFNYVAQDTGKYVFRNTTMTGAWGGGAFTTNASGITTTTTGCSLLTRQYFPVFGGAETYAYFKLGFTGTWLVTNKTIDTGFMTANTSNPYAPTDGVFVRANSTGLFGVVSVNGVEQTSSPFVSVFGGIDFIPAIGTFYDCIVTCGENVAVFWMDMRDGNGYTMMARISTAPGSGAPLYSGALQFGIRDVNTGTTSAVMGAKISRWSVSQGGYHTSRPWVEQVVCAGMSGAQGQQGGTMGSTALYTNSLAPGAGAVMTNTTAALGTGLGGQFSALPTLAANTDGIVCSYLNPVPTTGITGRVLVVTGIKISSIVSTVLAGGPVVYAFSAGWGNDALSLATAEAATTKASRRKALGFHQFVVNAAVYASGGPDIYLAVDDIAVNPGEYFQIIAKNIGVVTTTGVVTFHVSIQSHWES